MEKEIKSVANVTRRDVQEFLQYAAEIPIRPEVQEYALADANQTPMDPVDLFQFRASILF